MRTVLTTAIFGFLALSAIPANAAVFVYDFTSDHCTGGCSTGAPNMGTITVTDIAANEVSVVVTLEAGFGFISTGAGTGGSGNASFFFNTTSGSPITISGLSAGWTVPNLNGSGQQPAGSYAGDGLMNQYNHGLNCASVCAPSTPLSGPLDFDVTLAGLTAANFVSSPFFGADVSSTNGNTGLIDASPASSPVPEPTSTLLLGSVVVGLATLAKKKLQRSASN